MEGGCRSDEDRWLSNFQVVREWSSNSNYDEKDKKWKEWVKCVCDNECCGGVKFGFEKSNNEMQSKKVMQAIKINVCAQ